MNAKHLKNAMSHKLVFLAVGLALAIIAAASICTTSQAKANETDNENPKIILYGSGTSILHTADPIKWEEEFDIIQACFENIPQFDNVDFISSVSVIQIEREGHLILSITIRVIMKSGGREWSCQTSTYSNKRVESSLVWTCYDNSGNEVRIPLEGETPLDLDITKSYSFYEPGLNPGVNISGNVWDDQTKMPVPFSNVVYCQYNPWWDMYLPVEGVEAVKTDMLGRYTIEGITEEMLPGKVFVYDGINKIGESEPIWFLPEDMETLYMWPILINQEQPDPPVPPTPPDPPYPPGPNPPEPVPPVPPAPAPTPDNPGGGIAQTGDATPFAAIAVLAIIAALGCGVALRKEYF